jgi:hypothetical protein
MLKRLGIGAAAALLALGGFAGGAGVPQAEAQAAPRVDRAFLHGRWTDRGDCTADWVEFYADGRFVTNARAAGRWTLVRGQLTFIGERTISARVHATDRNTITLTHPDQTTGGSTRCPPPVPSTIAAAVAMSRPFGRRFLIGRWTDTGDCRAAIYFYADGRFTVPTGAGRWTLVREQLSFVGNSTVVARARSVGRNRILLIHQDGTIGQSLRC